MSDELTLKLSSPLTEEEMDLIMDYDLDHTSSIWFHTKHGKNVEFMKAIRCKDCKYHHPIDYCEERDGIWNDNDYCSYAERKEDA